MTFLAIVAFVVVQTLFLPLAIIGAGLVAYRQIWTSRKLGVSSTAIEIINGRWAMDVFGLREDKATRALNAALPNSSVFGMWLALFPLYLLYRISGKNFIFPRLPKLGEEGIADMVTARTLYFDEIIDQHKGSAEQFVLLGAGFDTRAYGQVKRSSIKCFELDQKETQTVKREALGRGGVDTSQVTYVEIDFEHDDWFDKLANSGYDESLKTIFLWEGVSLYLGRSDVDQTLQLFKSRAAEGSVLIADFYALRFVEGEMFPGMKTAMATLKLTDEEFGFGIDFSEDHDQEFVSFIESQDLKSGTRRFLGEKTEKGAWMVVAEVLNGGSIK